MAWSLLSNFVFPSHMQDFRKNLFGCTKHGPQFQITEFFPDVCKSEKFNCVIHSFGYQNIVSHKNGINELNEIFSV